MDNVFKNAAFSVGNSYDSPFLNKNGVYQDGTVPFARDKNGKLFAISGHSHMGNICMFSGTSFDDMVKLYPISTNFRVGSADAAFDQIKYSEGIRARGSIWPFGLYICPNTNRFFCFFHNETGWNGEGTAYDAIGYCQTPKCDSDFRHVGLMHSDDEGKNWTFDRWVLSGETACFTSAFNPDNVNVIGQQGDIIKLGSGDFSLFCPENDDFIYLFYNIIEIDVKKWEWTACNAYVARSRKRTDGIMGDFVKYDNGAFGEAGNFGKETPIVINAWHPRVAYFQAYHCYVLTSSPANFGNAKQLISDYMEIRTSKDLIHWSAPISIEKDGKKFGNHYQAVCSFHGMGDTYCVKENRFTVLNCHNGTDVKAFDCTVDTNV